MKHMSTWDLLDLAEEYKVISENPRMHLSSLARIVDIDTELLSRMPEGEFVTVYLAGIYGKDDGECLFCKLDTLWGDAPHADDCQVGRVIGFEPYIGEDNSHCYHEWNERYFGSVCYKCGAMKLLDGSMFIDEDCP